jgi:adenylate cyclase class 2
VFAELEIQAEEADYERAKSVILATAAELGLTEMERRSYLGMLLGNA